MIQELLGGSNSLIGENRKFSIFEGSTPPSSSPCLSPSSNSNTPSTTTTTTNSSTPNPNSNNPTSSSSVENLRCPRCDSSNTKFCYYNNYNLTQPRHFCKTCRRYWTKGGALRNVPIGGGCRKNKSSTTVSTSVGKSNGSTNKLKTMASEIGRSTCFVNGFDQFSSSSPILWASPPSSHLLSLLRASQNPNPESNSFGVKEEGCLIGNLNHLNMAEPLPTGGLNGRTLGFDPLAHQVPNLGLCSQIWKNSQQNGGLMVGSELGHQNSGIQELYQRLRSSTNNNYYSENSPLVVSNVAASSSSSTSASTSNSTILESSPVAAGAELGYWNPTFSWSDLNPTTNGAYP